MISDSSLREILCVSHDNTTLRVDICSVVDNNCRPNRLMTEKNQNECVRRSRERQERVYTKQPLDDRMIETTGEDKYKT